MKTWTAFKRGLWEMVYAGLVLIGALALTLALTAGLFIMEGKP